MNLKSKRYYKDRTKRMKGLIADEEAFDLPGGKFKVYVCGYGEADFGSSVTARRSLFSG